MKSVGAGQSDLCGCLRSDGDPGGRDDPDRQHHYQPFMVVIFGMSSAAAVMIGNQIGAGQVKLANEYAKMFSRLGLPWDRFRFNARGHFALPA